jgi:hypothetical protein
MSFGKEERIRLRIDKENATGRKNTVTQLANTPSKPSSTTTSSKEKDIRRE